MQNEYEVVAWCDGSCFPNPGPVGSWAAVLSHPRTGARKEFSGLILADDPRYACPIGVTNNRAELVAATECLRVVKHTCRVLVHCDSQNTVHTANDWCWSWQRRGWKKADGSPVANLDLVRQLHAELLRLGQHNVRFTWVRGHASEPENVRCDEIARAIRETHQKL